ncbi:MAG: methyltransferase family protein [Rhizobiaceae bacterium]
MDQFNKSPNRVPWPPLIYGAAILLGGFSPMLLPTPWVASPFSDFLSAIGVMLIVVALFIDFKAMSLMHAKKTTIMPNKGADHLVTTGAFSISRNPIYLANTMLTIGAGVCFGIIWFIPLALAAAFLTQKLAIEREEKHLASKFGKPWRDYTHKVRRWI